MQRECKGRHRECKCNARGMHGNAGNAEECKGRHRECKGNARGMQGNA